MVGFVGAITDFDLALHLIEIAVCLEKMVVKVDERFDIPPAGCKNAEELREKLRPGAELLIMKGPREPFICSSF